MHATPTAATLGGVNIGTPTTAEEPTDVLAGRLALSLFEGFARYHDRFFEVTDRAQRRFLGCDWRGHQHDADERLVLHEEMVSDLVGSAGRSLATLDDSTARSIWIEVRRRYIRMVATRADFELAETTYNSVTRRIFDIVGIDPDLEFLWLGATELPPVDSLGSELRRYPLGSSLESCVRATLAESTIADHFTDIDRDARLVAERLHDRFAGQWDAIDAIDMLRPVFYRNKGAYLVGRVRWLNRLSPFILPLLSSSEGVRVDAALLDEATASRLFGYTRSYFHVRCRRPAGVVAFVKSMLPAKPVAELYSALGFPQHGKTNLFRALARHLEHSNTRFEPARGTKGMVMTVFTLPSFDVVFKIIKDEFSPTKTTTRDEVKRRYRLVFTHDRVGRLVDAQEFENITLPRERFTPELLEELRAECGRTVEITEHDVALSHVYTERRVYPLDLYLSEMDDEATWAAAVDFGRAVRELASANIFPGDLLPKNFGVTRHDKVVFYDYDELSLLEDIRFRDIPPAPDYADEMSSQPWFAVDPLDVFPEELATYLRYPPVVAKAFAAEHEELFTTTFWRSMQQRHAEGLVPTFYPYPESLRFDPKASPDV